MDEKLKGDGWDVDDVALGANPVAVGAPKPAKLVGGAGIAAGADVADLKREKEGAGADDLFGKLEALLCVFTWDDLPS